MADELELFGVRLAIPFVQAAVRVSGNEAIATVVKLDVAWITAKVAVERPWVELLLSCGTSIRMIHTYVPFVLSFGPIDKFKVAIVVSRDEHGLATG